jgi:hypothetical protein
MDVKIDDAASGWLSKAAIQIAVAIVAEIVFAGSRLWHLLTGGAHNVQRGGPPGGPAALATFVGSETCIGCYQAVVVA